MERSERSDREGRDAAGIGPYARERERLTPLSTLDSWKVSEGEPDIRGWEIRTVSNRQLGTVADLLIDRDAGEVVLVDVDLPGTDRHTFVPIRVVQLDRAKRVVLMDSADLPDSDLARAERDVVRRPSDVPGTVRYQRSDRSDRSDRGDRSDRQVPNDRAMLADAPARNDLLSAREPTAGEPMADRRVEDRRRIDRVSTDL